MLDVTKGDMT